MGEVNKAALGEGQLVSQECCAQIQDNNNSRQQPCKSITSVPDPDQLFINSADKDLYTTVGRTQGREGRWVDR